MVPSPTSAPHPIRTVPAPASPRAVADRFTLFRSAARILHARRAIWPILKFAFIAIPAFRQRPSRAIANAEMVAEPSAKYA